MVAIPQLEPKHPWNSADWEETQLLDAGMLPLRPWKRLAQQAYCGEK